MTAFSSLRIATFGLWALGSLIIASTSAAADPSHASTDARLRPWNRKVVQQKVRESNVRAGEFKAESAAPAPAVSRMKPLSLLSRPPEELALAGDDYQRLRLLPAIESLRFEVAETVCVPDERVPVTNSLVPPFSGNCLLLLNLGNGSFARGTGWLASPTLVMTAGHCVHDGNGGNFYEDVEVIPGAYLSVNGSQTTLVRPFGSQKIPGVRLRASGEWKASGNVGRDYGAVLLNEPFHSAAGSPQHYSATVLDDAQLTGTTLTVAGYPGDKPTGTQWTHSGAASAVEVERLQYMVDTFGGESGSAVTIDDGGSAIAVGIHNYGGCPNKCTRITAGVAANINAWKAESVSRP